MSEKTKIKRGKTLLRKSIDVLSNNRWNRAYMLRGKSYCVMGAICAAGGIDIERLRNIGKPGAQDMEYLNGAYDEAIALIATALIDRQLEADNLHYPIDVSVTRDRISRLLDPEEHAWRHESARDALTRQIISWNDGHAKNGKDVEKLLAEAVALDKRQQRKVLEAAA